MTLIIKLASFGLVLGFLFILFVMKDELGKNYWFTYVLMISSILSIIGTAQLLKLYHFNPDEHTTPAGQQDVIVIFNPDQMLNKTLFGLNIFS